MSLNFQIYPDPLDAVVTLHSDDGFQGTGTRNVDANGREGQYISILDGIVSGHGAELVLEKEGYERFRVRGFLVHNGVDARLQVDDYVMTPTPVISEPAPPETGGPEEGPDPYANPLDIIMHVFNSTNPNLATVTGCGLFTEDCCKELHEKMHPGWGHIKKNPGQNQFNEHAVDAMMLIVPSGSTAPGIYDIIQDSASPNAKPVFNYVEPPIPDLWMYPPNSVQMRKEAGQKHSRFAK